MKTLSFLKREAEVWFHAEQGIPKFNQTVPGKRQKCVFENKEFALQWVPSTTVNDWQHWMPIGNYESPKEDEHFWGRLLCYLFSPPLPTGQSLIIYPGTFLPWHSGHSECLRQSLMKSPDTPHLVLPDLNPFKTVHQICPWKRYQSLLQETQLDPLGRKKCISPQLLSSRKANFLCHWIDSGQFRKKEKILLLGEDSFFNFRQWKNYSDILRALVEMRIVPREFPSPLKRREQKKHLLSFAPDLRVEFLKIHSFMEISSSQIREKISEEP